MFNNIVFEEQKWLNCWFGGRLVRALAWNAESRPTGSSLVRDSYCVRTLSKFFAHNSSAIGLLYWICAAEARTCTCKCTSELCVRRAISRLSCIVFHIDKTWSESAHMTPQRRVLTIATSCAQWCSCEISSGHTPMASAVARAYKKGMEAKLPAGSRGRTLVGGSEGEAPWSKSCFCIS